MQTLRPTNTWHWTTYLRVALSLSVVKTAWYTARFRRLIVVGRGSRLRVPWSARLNLDPGAVLTLGIAPVGSGGAVVELRPGAVFNVRGRVQFMRNARADVKHDARLSIGGGTYFNEYARIDCGADISIGAGCAIARGVVVMDSDAHVLIHAGAPTRQTAPVTIGDGCWLADGAIVLKGVDIGAGTVVAARALVTRSTAGGQLLIGQPARERGPVTWRL